MAVLRIVFCGEEYVLVGNMESGGAIAKRDDYENFRPSYAHLYPDGTIWCRHETIGRREDIEVLGESDAKPTDEAVTEMLTAFLCGDWNPWR